LGADSTKSRRPPANRLFRAAAAVLFAAAAAGAARADNDTYRMRIRGLTDVPYPSYQGDRCTTIEGSREAVWQILTNPRWASQWLLTDLEGVVPLSSKLKKGSALTKGEVLVLGVETKDGPRTVELTVLVAVENQLLALAVTKDDDVISPGAANLIYIYVPETTEKGKTDLYWATHYESDSPLAAAFAPLKGGKRRDEVRVERGLLVLWGLSEASVSLVKLRAAAPPAVRPAPPTPTPPAVRGCRAPCSTAGRSRRSGARRTTSCGAR